MTGFDLPENFHNNPEVLLRRVRPKTVHGQRPVPRELNLETATSSGSSNADSSSSSSNTNSSSSSSNTDDMVAAPEKTIREFSIPSSSNVPTGLAVNTWENFELKPGVIHMAQAIPFCGLATEDANNHLQQFLEICSTFTMKGASADAVKLRLFPFSLVGKTKQWFYLNRATLTTWDACSNSFLAKYFPLGKTNALRNKISSFQ